MGTLVDTLLGSDINYITLAVPFFFLLIGVEFVAGLIQNKKLYRFNDSINDLSCGVIDQTVGIFLKSLLFAGYLFLFEHFRVFEISTAPPAVKWIAALALMLGVDFCFYWFHRIAHEYAAPWATHVVHHQSEEYNLTVALRQSALEGCFAWIFYLPLAVLGFPPAWYVAMSALNLLYQFWIHTEAIGHLGPLEWVLNTPSHHRVHHARNPKYLDKNYAGMLIIWDRMFGTLQPEEEEPVYGLTRPLQSWNPLWANLHEWVELAEMAWRAPRWRDKVKIWFMPLGWTPPGLPEGPRAQPVTRATLDKYDPQLRLGLNLYVLAQFVVTVVLSVAVLILSDNHAPLKDILLPSLLVLWSLANLGGVLERKRWVLAAETVRLVALPFGIAAVAAEPLGWLAWAAASGFILISAVWLWCYRLEFRKSLPENSDQPATESVIQAPHTPRSLAVLSTEPFADRAADLQ
jgi:sterol desaturase/sphingolipid hydroxylase (fatty acid hydroxylase superfamily)